MLIRLLIYAVQEGYMDVQEGYMLKKIRMFIVVGFDMKGLYTTHHHHHHKLNVINISAVLDPILTKL